MKLARNNLIISFIVLIGISSVYSEDQIISEPHMKMSVEDQAPDLRRSHPIAHLKKHNSNQPKLNEKFTHEQSTADIMESYVKRLGLPLNRLSKARSQYVVTLKKGDRIKLNLDETFTTWVANKDGHVTLFLNRSGIHTIVATRDTNRIFKTTFSSGKYFVVTPNPWKLGILSFHSTDEPKQVYLPRPGTRFMKPWSRLPYSGDRLASAKRQKLVQDTKVLLTKFGLSEIDYSLQIRKGQAVVSLKKGAVLHLKPGAIYRAEQDNDIKLYFDPQTAREGFHTLQINKSSLTHLDLEESANVYVWTYNKKKPYLTFYSIDKVKDVYTPLDYAEDLFEPL